MNEPFELLTEARAERFVWVEFTADDEPIDMSIHEPDEAVVLSLYDGLSAPEVSQFESALPAALPPQIRTLLQNCSGFGLSLDISFTRYNEWNFGYLLPHVIVLSDDGCGNDWVIEIDPRTGCWEHVWFRCHDPNVLMYLCRTLNDFIEGVLDLSRFEKCQTGHRSILHGDRTNEVFERRFPLASNLRTTNIDNELSKFVAQLPDNATVVDLRNATRGDGFSTQAIPDGKPLLRHNHELLFAYTRKPALLQLFFRS